MVKQILKSQQTLQQSKEFDVSVLSPVGMLSPRRLKLPICYYFHFSVLMGKRKEESVSNSGSQKRQRKEYTDVHTDDSSASSQSVSSLKSHRDEDTEKFFVY